MKKRMKCLNVFLAGLLMTVVIGGCDVDVGEKQGLYGTVYLLNGTMTASGSGSPYYAYDGDDPSIFPNVNIEAMYVNGGDPEKGTSNGLGNFIISVKPEFYDQSGVACYYISAAYTGTANNHTGEYKAFWTNDVTSKNYVPVYAPAIGHFYGTEEGQYMPDNKIYLVPSGGVN